MGNFNDKIDQSKGGDNPFPEHEYREYTPCAVLKPYIKCFWSCNSEAAIHDPIKRIIVPDGCLDIIFNPNPHSGKSPFVIGAMTGPIVNQSQKLLGVRFQTGMAYCFLKTPLQCFTDQTADLAAVWGPGTQEIHSRLLETDLCGTLSVLTRELIKRLSQAAAPDRRILAAVSWMKKKHGSLSVQALSERLGMSRQHFKRQCAQYTGLSPKSLLITYRFKALMKQAKSNPTLSWSRLAVDAGYYDQAHLISEFKAMTGFTPTQYFPDIRRDGQDPL